MKRLVFCAMLLPGACSTVFAAPVFTTRLDDPQAVYLTLTAQAFGVHADGLADDSAAVQAAIDKAWSPAREGIAFVRSGHYRITRIIFVWPDERALSGESAEAARHP
jgi:hypothetical protein